MTAMAIDVSRAHSRNQRVKLAVQLALHLPFWAVVLLIASMMDTDASQRGVSETWATLVGLAEMGFGLVAAGFGACAGLLHGTEEAEDLRRERRALLLGAGALLCAGSSLILMTLAERAEVASAATGVWGPITLNLLAALLIAIRARGLDELNRTVARDAGHFAFLWLSWVGGTWAILAHLQFTTAPAPLDWLTMLHGFSFVAGLVALARKGGFAPLPG
jgi:hypothetical protein